MKTTSQYMWAAVAAAAFAFGTLSPLGAQANSPIQTRQHAMERVRDAMKVLGAMARKQAPFDTAQVRQNAGIMAEKLKAAAALFPKGSDKGDVETWAKAEIWAEGSTFAKSLETAQAAALALQSVKDEAAFGPALGELGHHCKSCHDQYRRPKE